MQGKQLQLMVVKDENIAEIGERDFIELEDEFQEKELATMELSHTSVVALAQHKTLKLRGKLHDRSVVVLMSVGLPIISYLCN